MGARDSTLCARTIGLVILMGRFIPVPLEKSPGRGGAGLLNREQGYADNAHITRLAVRVQGRDGRESLNAGITGAGHLLRD